MDHRIDPWVPPLCQIPEELQQRIPASIQAAFQQANPELDDRAGSVAQIRRYLHERPHLVETWQQYSYDKRWSPSPYLDQTEVGFYDHGYEDVDHFDSRVDACAEFIFREAAWVLKKRR